MAGPVTTVTPLGTHRNETPYPFCPGCGHGPILDHLNAALGRLELDPRKVVLVSDIGCSGLSDQYFATNAFHGLHGRSITYASGIKMARPDLKVVVIMGDGGTGIGGAHFLSAARRNIGLTVLVFNNFNFGMTGGQHSTTTPTGAVTSTTPGGNLERPLDICATAAVNGAGYVWRGTSFDADLSERIAEAIAGEGLAVLDIWELCTAYYVQRNKMSRKALATKSEELGQETGLLHREERPEFAAAYREWSAGERGKKARGGRFLPAAFTASLDRRFDLVVAGAAGGKVRSAARLVAEAAIRSGLWAVQRDDYPITVKTGHSIADLILSPTEIHYTGISQPDALVLLSEEGLKKAAHYLPVLGPESRVFTLPAFADVQTPARVTVIDPSLGSVRPTATSLALITLAAVLGDLGLFPPEALREAARAGPAAWAADNLRAIDAGLGL